MRRKVVTLSPLLGMVPPNTKIYCRGLSLCKIWILVRAIENLKENWKIFEKKKRNISLSISLEFPFTYTKATTNHKLWNT